MAERSIDSSRALADTEALVACYTVCSEHVGVEE